jgi:ABC-2 type transport system permease protein
MAVYKRGYEPYTGPLTPEWTRFLVIARAAYRRLFDSRLLIAFFVVCYIYPLVAAVLIYLPHNAAASELFDFRKVISINGTFFYRYMAQQGMFAFLMTGFIGPGLVAPDIANNALPLYFCRPFSRTEYVLGKMSVLAFLLSAITWAPGLLLFGFAAYLEGPAWLLANWWMAVGLLVGSWAWIVTLCFLALAMSAWVKWRIAAGALIFGIFFVAAGFGEAINHALDTKLGHLVNIVAVIQTVWHEMFRMTTDVNMPLPVAWAVLAAFCGACYWLMAKKLRAYHVERS